MRRFGLMIVVLAMVSLAGCGASQAGGAKVADIDYTVVEDEKVPKELLEMITEKKSADFKMSYEAGDYLYIVRGYGQQETGGYSIAVNDIYLTSNAIYLKTTLIGPGENGEVPKAPSYPYIVIKVEKQGKNVVFD